MTESSGQAEQTFQPRFGGKPITGRKNMNENNKYADEELLTERQAAALMRISYSTLGSCRRRGKGECPDYYQYSFKVIRYKKLDIMAFIESKRVKSS